MKVDLSIPAIRDLVEHFSSGMKKLRDQARNLRIKNNALQTENFHMRCVTIDIIMGERRCSWEEANAFLNQRMENQAPADKHASVN